MSKNTHCPRFLASALSIASVLALSGALGASCASAPDILLEYESEDVAESEPVVARVAWLINVRENISENLCTESEMFRSCYQIAESDCRERARQATTSCEYQVWNSIPEILTNEQGQRLGAEIGRCAGSGMVQTFNATYDYQETEQCKRVLSEL